MPKKTNDPQKIYNLLYQTYGAQSWWPADSPFEVMIGAILTQNTAWSNVVKAINNLRDSVGLTPEAILQLSEIELAELIKPSGYFNLKAKRLKNYCRWYTENGQLQYLNTLATQQLRTHLLSINGIGPETADDILLYAFHRPVFVIDTYTRRLFQRLGCIKGDEPYEVLRAWLENSIEKDPKVLNEYHALIVQHAKIACRKKPVCTQCTLKAVCHQEE